MYKILSFRFDAMQPYISTLLYAINKLTGQALKDNMVLTMISWSTEN